MLGGNGSHASLSMLSSHINFLLNPEVQSLPYSYNMFPVRRLAYQSACSAAAFPTSCAVSRLAGTIIIPCCGIHGHKASKWQINYSNQILRSNTTEQTCLLHRDRRNYEGFFGNRGRAAFLNRSSLHPVEHLWTVWSLRTAISPGSLHKALPFPSVCARRATCHV